MDHLLTTYHISTPTCPLSLPCADLTTLHQCPFKSALGRLRLPKCGHDKKRPSSGGSRTNTATTDLTQHHCSREPHQPAPARTNPTSTLPLHYPGIYKASAWVRALGGSTTAPSAPTRKGAGGGGSSCVRPVLASCPTLLHSDTPNAKKAPSTCTLSGGGGGGGCDIFRGSNPGAGRVCTRDVGVGGAVVAVQVGWVVWSHTMKQQ